MNNRIFVNSPILLSEFCRSKRTRRIVAAVSAFCMLTVGSPTAFAGTSLLGGKAVLEGLTRVTQGATTADSVTFNSSAKVGILDWSKYNIGAGQSMTYNGAGTTFFNLVNGAAGKSQIDGMINGNKALALVYSGDAVTILEENENMPYYVPKCGSNVFCDSMVKYRLRTDYVSIPLMLHYIDTHTGWVLHSLTETEESDV